MLGSRNWKVLRAHAADGAYQMGASGSASSLSGVLCFGAGKIGERWWKALLGWNMPAPLPADAALSLARGW